MKSVILGVDIGGTKIALGLVDGAGEMLWEERDSSRAEEGGEALLHRVTTMVRETLMRAADAYRVLGVGVATPGQIDYARGAIRHATDNLPEWAGVPLVEHLEGVTGLPVRLDNDGNLAALGEARFGAGRGHEHVVCVTVGTGIGGGIVHKGQLIQGASGSAGGLGHVSCQAIDGPRCYCGNRGCIELYSSGRAIAARARASIGNGVPSLLNGDAIYGAREVIAAARKGDALARNVLEEAGHNLGLALLQVINLFNPSCLIVSGGVAEAGDLLLAPLSKIVHSRALPSAREAVNVRLGELSGAAGVIGAATMVWDTLEAASAPELESTRLGAQT